MIEKLKEFLDVQEIDLRITALYQEKEALPQELKRFEDAVRNEEAGKKELEDEDQNLVKERRQKERELEGKNDTHKKFQEQLYQLKSNKEYTAFLSEIENVKKEIEKLEDEILVLMEKIEEKEKNLAEINNTLKERRREFEDASKRNEEKTAEIDRRLEEWQKDREEKVAHIPGELLKQYERVRHARNGIGLVAIKNNACQGCYMELPPQVISEVRLGHRMVTCENCNRLLYLDNNP